MHELTIASSIVEAVIDLASKQASSRVLTVQLRIGKLRTLSSEQVKFSYNILAKGTVLEGSELAVEETTARVKCPTCNYQKEVEPDDNPAFHFGLPTLICPQCSSALNIEGGDECVITSVQMIIPTVWKDTPEPPPKA